MHVRTRGIWTGHLRELCQDRRAKEDTPLSSRVELEESLEGEVDPPVAPQLPAVP